MLLASLVVGGYKVTPVQLAPGESMGSLVEKEQPEPPDPMEALEQTDRLVNLDALVALDLKALLVQWDLGGHLVTGVIKVHPAYKEILVALVQQVLEDTLDPPVQQGVLELPERLAPRVLPGLLVGRGIFAELRRNRQKGDLRSLRTPPVLFKYPGE